MKPRDIARSVITAGIGTGAALILAGVPAFAAVAVLAVICAAAVLLERRGPAVASAIRLTVTAWLERDRTRTSKKGTTVERA